MKRLHRSDLYAWSQFDRERNVDFNSVLWVRSEGNVIIDPMPLSAHDEAHLAELGGVAWVVVTNSDHTRAAEDLRRLHGAKIAGPAAEQAAFGISCDRWLKEGDELVPGLVTLELEGSKTPGELALVLEGTTLITGDLVRAHRAGSLMLLPDAKLKDKGAARESVRRLSELPDVDVVLVGDGWHVFSGGRDALRALAEGV